MNTRMLGRTSVRVSALSFGAAGIGNLYTPVDAVTARLTVQAAWAAGIWGELKGAGLAPESVPVPDSAR